MTPAKEPARNARRRRRSPRVVLAAVLVASACACARTGAPPGPETFESLDAASLEAMGGAKALATIRSLHALADCIGPRGPYTTEIHSARGRRTRFRQVSDDGEFVGYVNGDAVWSVDPATNAVTPLGRQQAEMFRGHEFQMIPFDLPGRFTGLVVEDEAPFAGRPCRRVGAVDALGLPARIWFDPQTSLLAGFEITDPRGEDGGMVRVVVDSWRRTGEVLLPSRVTATDRSGDWVLDFHTIEIDVVDEGMFDVPPGS